MTSVTTTVTPARASRTIDVIERVIALTLFIFLCVRMKESIIDRADVFHLLIVLVEFSIICFMLLRRFASTISLSPVDWLIAGLGTCLPTLAMPGDPAPIVPELVSEFLMIFGSVLQFHGKLTLNTSFGIIAANRGVKSRGPYVLVRHPIYLGYSLTHLGFVLYAPNLWNAVIYTAAFGLQVLRILAEERVLAKDEAYRALSARVRYRLVPGIF